MLSGHVNKLTHLDLNTYINTVTINDKYPIEARMLYLRIEG